MCGGELVELIRRCVFLICGEFWWNCEDDVFFMFGGELVELRRRCVCVCVMCWGALVEL